MLLEMAKRRALELVERSNFRQEMHLYSNTIDAQWLGVGVGFALAKGWIESVGCGEFDLTLKGRCELSRMRYENAPCMPDNLVPTRLTENDKHYYTVALKRAG